MSINNKKSSTSTNVFVLLLETLNTFGYTVYIRKYLMFLKDFSSNKNVNNYELLPVFY